MTASIMAEEEAAMPGMPVEINFTSPAGYWLASPLVVGE